MRPSIHPQARLFDECADLYRQYRPPYPEAAITVISARLNVSPNGWICDLGAGPGTLSFLLAERGYRLLAVEPLEAMRVCGARWARERQLPVTFVGGQAEAIPLADGSVQAVVCGQAFHWFQTGRALAEIGRVLAPAGGLALLWNNRDWQHIPWLARLERLLMKYNPHYTPNYRARDWSRVLNETRLFTRTVRWEFVRDTEVAPEHILGLIESLSYVRILPDEHRQRLKQELATLLNGECLSRRRSTLPLRYRTELYLAEKR
ncbi:MAG: class I SAM-dependent methyltransferase [Acidobacteria bacterium]|nr:MAG: class I SAM-dependent methyltransferase [Acidobacteriota bacterium]